MLPGPPLGCWPCSAIFGKHRQAGLLATRMCPEARGSGRHPETPVICPFLRRDSGGGSCPGPARHHTQSVLWAIWDDEVGTRRVGL